MALAVKAQSQISLRTKARWRRSWSTALGREGAGQISLRCAAERRTRAGERARATLAVMRAGGTGTVTVPRGAVAICSRPMCQRRRRLRAIVAAGVALLSLGFAPSVLAAGTGRIAGEVSDASLKLGIGDVKVCAAASSTPWVCTETTVAGEYTISGLASGNYDVRFTAPTGSGYISPVSHEGPVAVSEGHTAEGIDTELEEGGRVSGTITSAASNSPLEGVEVCARQASEEAQRPLPCATTNSAGEYIISGLPTSEYKIEFRFSWPGDEETPYVTPEFYDDQYFVWELSQADPLPVKAGYITTGINAAREEYGSITGQVTNAETGLPIEGIAVHAHNENGNWNGLQVLTNQNGEYTIPRLGDRHNEYHLEFAPPFESKLNYSEQWYDSTSATGNTVFVSFGKTTPGIDAELIEGGGEGGKITGRVTEAATHLAITGADACAYNKAYRGGVCSVTGSYGEYTISHLSSGEYEVSFSMPSRTYYTQWYDGKAYSSEAQKVSVGDEETASKVNDALEEVDGGAIVGEAWNATTGARLAGIGVCAYEAVGKVISTLNRDCTRTDPHGAYRLEALMSGEYVVEFFAPAGSGLGYGAQYYDGKPSSGEADRVSVTTGSYVPDVDAAMTEGG